MKYVKCKLPVQLYPENGKVIAYCPALQLCTSADTQAQAQKRFAEALRIFFEEINQPDLPKVLRELGWKQIKQGWKPPPQPKQIEEEVNIPVPA